MVEIARLDTHYRLLENMCSNAVVVLLQVVDTPLAQQLLRPVSRDTRAEEEARKQQQASPCLQFQRFDFGSERSYCRL